MASTKKYQDKANEIVKKVKEEVKKNILDEFPELNQKTNYKSTKKTKVKKESNTKYCIKCGKELDENSKFCISCGTSFEKEQKNENIKEKNNDKEREENDKDTNKKFCSHCGEEVDREDKFCDSCGKELKKKRISKKETNDKEKVTTKKCPNCGASIKSFQTKCKYCQAEISNITVSNSLEEFSKGLTEIQSKPLPKYEFDNSMIKKIRGKSKKDEEEERKFNAEARRLREDEIVNFIINYPIPNSNEDLVEFMLMANSNIKLKSNTTMNIKRAWYEKKDQIYKKAKMSMTEEDLNEFNKIYYINQPINNNIINNNLSTKKTNKDTIIAIIAIVSLYLLMVKPVLFIIIIFAVGLLYLKFVKKVNFRTKEICSFLNKIYLNIKKGINNFIKYLKNLSNKQKKVIGSIVCAMFLLVFTLFIVNIINEDNDNNKVNNEQEYTNKDYSEISYHTAEDFEKALNDGKDVNGTIVKFVVLEYKPDSSLGVNCWAGEHLNFISQDKLDVKSGDEVIGKVTKEPKKVLGSWQIKYEVIEILPRVEESTDSKEDESEESTPIENQKDEEQVGNKENIVIMIVLPEEYIGKNYKDVESEMKDLGYTNIILEKKSTDDSEKDKTIKEFTIAGNSYERFTEFYKDDEVKIVYWEYKKQESKYEKAFIRDLPDYDLYLMFDEDTKEVVHFGTNDSGIMKSKYKGKFSTGIDIDWSDYQEGWHENFIYKDDKKGIHTDYNGFEWEYEVCDIEKAQSILDNINT